jgi:Pyruvate/2-oxoacid:ferredoxin oxidoreductase gamma subunit
MILLGTVIRETGCIREETLEDALKHVIPARKMNLMDVNLRAVRAGKEYQP